MVAEGKPDGGNRDTLEARALPGGDKKAVGPLREKEGAAGAAPSFSALTSPLTWLAYSFSLSALLTLPARRRAEASLPDIEGADRVSVTARNASVVASP
jgi:hypothetical protein